jgi:hypothetical protein
MDRVTLIPTPARVDDSNCRRDRKAIFGGRAFGPTTTRAFRMICNDRDDSVEVRSFQPSLNILGFRWIYWGATLRRALAMVTLQSLRAQKQFEVKSQFQGQKLS